MKFLVTFQRSQKSQKCLPFGPISIFWALVWFFDSTKKTLRLFTIARMVIHHQKYGHQLSRRWSPNFQMMVPNDPQDGQTPSQGGQPTIQRFFTHQPKESHTLSSGWSPTIPTIWLHTIHTWYLLMYVTWWCDLTLLNWFILSDISHVLPGTCYLAFILRNL